MGSIPIQATRRYREDTDNLGRPGFLSYKFSAGPGAYIPSRKKNDGTTTERGDC